MATLTVSAVADGKQRTTLRATNATQEFRPWTEWERILFRVGTLFVLQLVVPFRAQFYQRLFPIHSLRELYSFSGSGGINYVAPIGESGQIGRAHV